MKPTDIETAKKMEKGLMLSLEGLNILMECTGADEGSEALNYRIMLQGTLVEIQNTIKELEAKSGVAQTG